VTTAFLVVTLALIWAGATGSFSGLNLLFGALVGGVAVLVLRSSLAGPSTLRKARRILSLLALFLYELNVSAIRVALVVMRPDIKAALRPAIIAVPLKVRSDAEITLLANMITLTPGTLSIDVSADRSVLYVHTLNLGTREAMIADIANGFEKKIQEVFE
jgi:multicomponent Na+:H+ antiporter subunit E